MYLLVSGDTLVHVPHKNLCPLFPLGVSPFPLVPFEHAFPSRIHLESGKALHLLDPYPGSDPRGSILHRRPFLLFLWYGWLGILPDDSRLPPFSGYRFRLDDVRVWRFGSEG